MGIIDSSKKIKLHLQTILYYKITKYMCRIWCSLSAPEILCRSPSLRSCRVGLTSCRTCPNFFSTSNISLNFFILFSASLECIAAFLIISRASVMINVYWRSVIYFNIQLDILWPMEQQDYKFSLTFWFLSIRRVFRKLL